MAIVDPSEKYGAEDGVDMECTFCSGLGHRITNCPKLETQQRSVMASQRAMHTGAKGDY